MAYLSEALRQQVLERAHGRCEYCQTQQVVVISMEIGIYSPIHGIRLKICELEPKKHIMNPIGLGQNAVCTGR